MKKCLLSLSLLVASNLAFAQKINPEPQFLQSGTASLSLALGVSIKSAKIPDSSSLSELNSFLSESQQGIALYVGNAKDSHMKSIAKRVKLKEKSGAYYLQVTSKEIVIMGYDARGTFYGVQTLKQLINNNQLTEIEISDYPDTQFRGVVEGFYGYPWSHEKRLRLIEFLGRYKMDTYIYGPKDDPYHSSLSNPTFSKYQVKGGWRLPYPAEEAAKIKELVEASKQNKVDFVWAIHPGQDIQWNDEDFIHIIAKFEMMYQIGVRSFAVFFDDISGEGTDPTKQAGLLNRINAEFIQRKKDVTPLIMCPTEYNKAWASPKEDGYLPTLGNLLDPSIYVMWTGDRVCDDITLQSLEWINSRTKRPAYIWWNFPVNDYAKSALPQGPSYGLDTQITSDDMIGFTSNPMEHIEASKIALYGIANYTWNIKSYDSNQAWEDAIQAVVPEAAAAYRTFAIHSADLGQNFHRYRRDESWETKLIDPTNYCESDFEALNETFKEIENSVPILLQSNLKPGLLEEIHPWLVQFQKLGKRGVHLLNLIKAVESKQDALAWSSLLSAEMNSEQLKAYKAHKSGSLLLQPFIDTTRFQFSRKLYEQVSGACLATSQSDQSHQIYTNIPQIESGGADMSGDWVLLNPVQEVLRIAQNQYVGIDLGSVTGINEVNIDLGFKNPLIEYSQDAQNWSDTKPQSARYVRYLNRTNQVVEARLRRFQVSIDPRGGDIDAATDQDFSTGFAIRGESSLFIPQNSREAIIFSEKEGLFVNGKPVRKLESITLAPEERTIRLSGSGVVREVIFK
ncbi:MAG: beta-N-acetylglucosaminidase domain-containing protein [Phocaeicola sp.]